MPRYVIDPETGEQVEQTGIPNLTIDWISRRPKPIAWSCAFCFSKLKLKPIDKKIPPSHWECHVCLRKITLQERDETFSKVRQEVEREYGLTELGYDKSKDTWSIQGEWRSEDGDRLTAKKQQISKEVRQIIIDTMLERLEQKLGIGHLSSAKDYFLE
jgi:hypothetical protein